MTAAPFSDELLDVLRESQRLGFFGERDVLDAAGHARGFVGALVPVAGSLLDIGAGGGLPGLVIAHDRPDLTITLVDRRAKRTDFLRRVVRRLGWNDRVSVEEADVRVVIETGRQFDVVVARGFGPPRDTLTYASQLVGGGGRIVISEPPESDRWDADLLEELGLIRIPHEDSSVVVFAPESSG